MNILVIPDLHCPYQHPAALDFIADLSRRHKPKEIVCLGDEIDCYNFSTYRKNPDAPGRAEEVRLAKAALQPWFKLFPRVKVCESNHAIRPYKRAEDVGLPGAFLRTLKEVLEAPEGWRWQFSWTVEGVYFVHGDGFSGKGAALNACEKFRRSTVIGHIHAHAGVFYSSSPFDTVWGMNAGCLIDPNSLACDYAKHIATRPCLGAGLILDGVPLFVPLRV